MIPTADRLKSLPDLPELDTVEVWNRATIAFLAGYALFIAAMVGLLVWQLAVLWRYVDIVPAVLVGVLAILCVYVLIRLLDGVYFYRTDRTGITANSMLRRREIGWVEVTDAEIVGDCPFNIAMRIRTTDGCLTVGQGLSSAASRDALLASAYQHLRRVGKADQMELPDTALSLWDRIPDDVGREAEWSAKRRWGSKAELALCFVFFGGQFGLMAWMVCSEPRMAFLAVMALPLLACFRMCAREAANRAVYAAVRDDALHATTARGDRVIPWTEVTSACWERSFLAIRSASREVWIPMLAGDECSEKLVLACIRRARAAGHPLTVPSPLRAASRDSSEPTAPVELRLSSYEKKLLLVFCGFYTMPLSIAPILHDPRRPLLAAAILCGAAILMYLVWRIAGTYALRVDDEGIAKRFLGWRKFVSWRDVASCELAKEAQKRLRGTRVLRDINGKTLFEFPPRFGRECDRNMLMAFLEAKLPSSTPCADSDRPYLARPWSPAEH